MKDVEGSLLEHFTVIPFSLVKDEGGGELITAFTVIPFIYWRMKGEGSLLQHLQ